MALVGHWKFDDGTGTSAADSSGNNYTGTLVNTPTWSAGLIGSNSILFGGNSSSQKVTTSGTSANNLDTAGSFSIWGNKTSDGQTYNVMMSNGNYATDRNGVIFDWRTEFLNYEVCSASAVITGSISVPNFTPGGWHHAVITWDGSFIKVYADGVLVINNNQTITPVTTVYDVVIGSDTNYGSAYFYGYLDDARLYSHALTQDEVHALYILGQATIGGGKSFGT